MDAGTHATGSPASWDWLAGAERARQLGERGPSIAEMTRLTSFAEIDEALRLREFQQAGKHRDSAAFTIHTVADLSGGEHFERRRLEAGILRGSILVEFSLRDHDEVVSEALVAKKQFVEQFFAPSWARREALVTDVEAGRRDRADLPNDLLTLMLRHQDHFGKWDQDVYVREARIFLTAGAEAPTRTVTQYAVELSGWLDAHPEDASWVTDMAFIRDALTEALRLHPGAPKIRRAVSDVVLSTGRSVQAGEYVYLDPHAGNRDVEMFGEDAHAFRPGRTVNSSVPYGLAFGRGPHTCIGKGLALGEGAADRDGMVARVIQALYAAGMRLDPEDPPCRRDDVLLDEFAVFPALFEAPRYPRRSPKMRM